VYKDELYAWGNFTLKVGEKKYYNSAKWDGEKWTPLGDDYYNDAFSLSDSYPLNGEYYSSGQFNNKEGNYAHYVLKWNGTKWGRLSKQIGGTNGVSDIAIYNNALFAAESFFEQDNKIIRDNYDKKQIRSIKKWNGTEWTSCGAFDKPVQCMYPYKGELIVTGLFTKIGGKEIKYMAKYKE